MSTLTSHAHSVRLAFHSLREAGATWRNTAAKAHSAAVMGLCHARVNDPDDEMMNAHPLGEHEAEDKMHELWSEGQAKQAKRQKTQGPRMPCPVCQSAGY